MRTVCGRGKRSEFSPESPAWIRLRQVIGTGPVLWKLSRLIGFCSAAGIAPEAVDDATTEQFRVALIKSVEVNRPEERVRAAVRAWNRMAKTLPDWPGATLSLAPPRISRWTIEPDKFPVSFRDEIERWLIRMSKVDPEDTDIDGLVRALRPETLRLRRHQVYKAASALVFSGTPIDEIISLNCLVDLDSFKKLMRYLRERGGVR